MGFTFSWNLGSWWSIPSRFPYPRPLSHRPPIPRERGAAARAF
jgi:hypothetical protein